MTIPDHTLSEIIFDPVPDEHWRRASPIAGTRLGFCSNCGFCHVHPYPDAAYLADFYSRYEMSFPQANLAETARLLARNIPRSTTIVDIGCGDGGFLKEMHALEFENLVGLDQSPGIERAKQLGFGRFFRSSVGEFLGDGGAARGVAADAIVMVNVLEHVAEPLALLRRIHAVLPANGYLCVTVPNDFSPLQRAFLKAKGHRPWFVVLPDHLNYFTFDTLRHALRSTGFGIIDQSALYPLELFLLQDLDYIKNPELGPVAHQRRVMFEENMKAAGMTDALDDFYRTLASGGYGRDVMVVAKKT